MTEKLLTTEDARKLLGVTEEFFHAMVENQEIKPTKVVDEQMLFDRKAVLAFKNGGLRAYTPYGSEG